MSNLARMLPFLLLYGCAGVHYSIETPQGYKVSVRDYTDRSGVVFRLETESAKVLLIKDDVNASKAIETQADAVSGSWLWDWLK